jgi:AraC-like DNA-binding protein
MKGRGTVSAELARLFLLYAERRGIDSALAVRALGVGEIRDGERIDGARVAGLLSRFSELAGDPLFGIRLGSWAAKQPIHHLVLVTALASGTAGGALERLLRFHALLADALSPEIVRDGDVAELRVLAGSAEREGGQLAEAAVAMLAGLVRRIGGAGAGVEVLLRRAPATGCRSALGTEVRFGAPVDAVRFPASVLAVPNPLADPELVELLDRHAAGRLAALGRERWTARTARAVREGLVKNGCVPTLREVSHGLAVPQRTLQARLREEATGFRQLVDEVRRERGEALLADPTVALIEVAFLLGFGDQSAFTNAFRRWTGRTPAAYRRSISAVRR